MQVNIANHECTICWDGVYYFALSDYPRITPWEMKDNEIIGSYGLIVNDFISRQDLWPWLCAVYIEEHERGKALGSRLLEHGRQETAKLGFSKLYLCTDHIGFYEKYGWRYIGGAYGVSGRETRIYEIESEVNI